MPRVFLTARWLNLVLLNYRVPPALLVPHVPPGSELDTPDDANDTHLLSVVAFHFADTAVFRVPMPTAGWFPEMNLRFYVRRGNKRATVFLREYVPNRLIAWSARRLYHQPYFLAQLRHDWKAEADSIEVSTAIDFEGFRGLFSVRAENHPFTPPRESEEHFLKEHYWGFDRAPGGKSFRYRVDHPVWRCFPVSDFDIALDPGALLGGDWRDLDWSTSLHSVLCAEGSKVAVYTPEPLVQ